MKGKEAFIGELRHLAPFRRMKDSDLAPLAETCEVVDVVAEQYVVHDGAEMDAFWVVTDGVLTTFRDAVGEPVVLLRRLYRGDFFGHVGYFGEGRYTAAVRANEPSRLLRIAKSDLAAYLETHPEAREALETSAAQLHGASLAATFEAEKHRTMRVRLHHEVNLELADGSTHRARLHNLSVGGFCLERAPQDWRPDATVRFGLGLRSGTLQLGGRVIWRRDDTVGLQFTEMLAHHDVIIQLAIRLLLEAPPPSGEDRES